MNYLRPWTHTDESSLGKSSVQPLFELCGTQTFTLL